MFSAVTKLDARVELLGQRYDKDKIQLAVLSAEISGTRAAIDKANLRIERETKALVATAVFEYVEAGQVTTNPLFAGSLSSAEAQSVYENVASGDGSYEIAQIQRYKRRLFHSHGQLGLELEASLNATAQANAAFTQARVLQRALKEKIAQVHGEVAVLIARYETQAAQASLRALYGSSAVGSGLKAPALDPRANRAVLAALGYLGVPYVWGGDSRRGVDCSGLTMLAWRAAGVDLSHYSGYQFTETRRVPLYDIHPGDLLFYGYDGDEHVTMYVGDGKMIEAEMTGTRVHIVPIRLGYGFAGVGRP